jgi:hypothetical protein
MLNVMEAAMNGHVSPLVVVGLLVDSTDPVLLVKVNRTSRFDRHEGSLQIETSSTQSAVTWTFTVRVPGDAATRKKSTSASELMRPRSIVPLVMAVAVAAVLP